MSRGLGWLQRELIESLSRSTETWVSLEEMGFKHGHRSAKRALRGLELRGYVELDYRHVDVDYNGPVWRSVTTRYVLMAKLKTPWSDDGGAAVRAHLDELYGRIMPRGRA